MPAAPQKENETDTQYAARLAENARTRSRYAAKHGKKEDHKNKQPDKLARSDDEKDEVSRCRALSGLQVIVSKQRKCLRCNKSFFSNDAGNRRCSHCCGIARREPDLQISFANPLDATV